jgi:pimeloyl-ACP methyl ester carboxylesterase
MQSETGVFTPRIIRTIALCALLAGTVAFPASLLAQAHPPPVEASIPYGENLERGSFTNVNGIKLYFEVYGSGQTMLIIHGNGQSIASMKDQVKFFSDHYHVIAADSRGHGKSQMGAGRLTYEQMANDFNALLDQLDLKSVYVLGWSDGGIVGLLLAIKHPEKVSKLAIMGANLEPSGAYHWAQEAVAKHEKEIDEMIARGDTSKAWADHKQFLDLLGKQPNIPIDDLRLIGAPTLVMAADKDIIRIEHTVQIFQNIKNSHLSIFPGATHWIPRDNPKLFNETVLDFFEKPFSRPDSKDRFK